MAKPILLQTTSINIGDTTLICMLVGTLYRRFATSSARKSTISNANGIK